MKCYNVFHVLLLEPTTNNAYPGENMEPLPPVEIDSKDKYFIEAVLNSRIHQRKLQYLIKWVSYNLPDWEPTELYSESEAVNTFYGKNPNKPGPLSNQL
jgi:hypothetical protein